MPPANKVDVVGKLKCVDVEKSGSARSAANIKRATCRNAHIVRNRDSHIDSQIFDDDILRVRPAIVAPPREGCMERVDRRRLKVYVSPSVNPCARSTFPGLTVTRMFAASQFAGRL